MTYCVHFFEAWTKFLHGRFDKLKVWDLILVHKYWGKCFSGYTCTGKDNASISLLWLINSHYKSHCVIWGNFGSSICWMLFLWRFRIIKGMILLGSLWPTWGSCLGDQAHKMCLRYESKFCPWNMLNSPKKLHEHILKFKIFFFKYPYFCNKIHVFFISYCKYFSASTQRNKQRRAVNTRTRER